MADAESGTGSLPAGELSEATTDARDVTLLLRAWQDGDAAAGEQLFDAVYGDLRRIASQHLRRQAEVSLQPTELVNEAYLKIQGSGRLRWQSRLQFFGFAARVVRHVLVDRLRHHGAAKRNRDAIAVDLDPERLAEPSRDLDLLALDQALDQLAAYDGQAVRIVELRYFAGLTVPEVAELMGLGTATVSRRWQMARAWLRRCLAESGGGAATAEP